MAFKMAATVAVVAVLLTLMPATSFGDAADKELAELVHQLRAQLMKTKQTVRTQHDNYHEVRYRLDAKSSLRKSPKVSRSVTITASQQNALVDAINGARRNQKASDMYMMRWNNELANLAQQWSDQCQFTHGTPLFEASEVGFSDVGQNNWAFQGSFDPPDVVNDWLSEKQYYNEASGDCRGGGCTHFRQLVWSTTTDVGCAITNCGSIGSITSGGNFLVCYFGPAGNFEDEPAYQPATSASGPCTKCASGQFYCNNDLCDDTCTQAGPSCVCKAACKNCATQTSDCGCKCNAGSVGVDCSGLCEDEKSYCQTDYSNICYLDFVMELCPKTCGVCVTTDPCTGSSASAGAPAGAGGSPAASQPPSAPAQSPASASASASASQSSSGSEPPKVDPSQYLQHGLTEGQKKRFVYLLNKYRAEAGASNMNMLVWDDKLAAIGQEWSDRCIFEHRVLSAPGGHGYVDPESVGFPTTTLGENIWAFSDNSQLVPDEAVRAWDHEKNDYDFNTATCTPGKECGHYIANMWAFTRAVGCGFTKCASLQAPSGVWTGGVMVSCNFAGGADMDKQPFKLGSPCTECSSGHLYCTNKLCDNSCTSAGSGGACECNAQCVHGTLASGCSCHCSRGYMGGQCKDTCRDLAVECDTDWAFTECNADLLSLFGFSFMYEKIVRSCPKLCGHCVADSRKASSNHGRHQIRDSSESEEAVADAAATTQVPAAVTADPLGQGQPPAEPVAPTVRKFLRQYYRRHNQVRDSSEEPAGTAAPASGYGLPVNATLVPFGNVVPQASSPAPAVAFGDGVPQAHAVAFGHKASRKSGRHQIRDSSESEEVVADAAVTTEVPAAVTADPLGQGQPPADPLAPAIRKFLSQYLRRNQARDD